MAKTEKERLIELRNQSANNQFKAFLKQDTKGFVYFAKEYMFHGKRLKRLDLISAGGPNEVISALDREIECLEKELMEDLNKYLGEKEKTPVTAGVHKK
ncbi:hypothetical protein NLU03_23015 [Bacillus toyonensis]|nr:hypothetical protein [Bacillus toyonensis]